MMKLSVKLFACIIISCFVLFQLLHAASAQKAMFAHVVVGILADYTQQKWAQEIADASASGIDAFALNIAKDSYTDQQLGYAYAAAEAAKFKMFISFDFSYYSLPADANLIASRINAHANSPAQYTVNGKALVTTFVGDNQDWSGVKSQANIFFLANWADPNSVASNAQVDGGYPWNAWGSVNNRGVADPKPNLVNQDTTWMNTLGSKVYAAPVSPWFFTHYSPSSYNKNWIFPTEDLYLVRWQHLLDLKPRFVYQLTWNDYSESTYVAPLRNDPNLYPAGASAWAANMPHDGFRLIQKAYVDAYKSGASTPVIHTDTIVYWYRIQSKNAQCNDATGEPDAFQYVSDTLFVVTLLTSPATLVVTTGRSAGGSLEVGAGASMSKVGVRAGRQAFSLVRNGATLKSGTSPPVSFKVGAGASLSKVAIQAGLQTFSLVRKGATLKSGTSPQTFSSDCPSNVYNYNVFVGTL